MPIASTRAVRPIAFGIWLIRRLTMKTSTVVPVSLISSSVSSSSSSALPIASITVCRAAASSAQAVLRSASAGRGLTGSGPCPRFCGTGGFIGLPDTTRFTPSVSPYM